MHLQDALWQVFFKMVPFLVVVSLLRKIILPKGSREDKLRKYIYTDWQSNRDNRQSEKFKAQVSCSSLKIASSN